MKAQHLYFFSTLFLGLSCWQNVEAAGLIITQVQPAPAMMQVGETTTPSNSPVYSVLNNSSVNLDILDNYLITIPGSTPGSFYPASEYSAQYDPNCNSVDPGHSCNFTITLHPTTFADVFQLGPQLGGIYAPAQDQRLTVKIFTAWSTLNTGLPDSPNVRQLNTSGVTIYAVLPTGLYQYNTSATDPTWTLTNTALADLTATSFDNAGNLYVSSSSAGVYQSQNSAWVAYNTGLANTSVNALIYAQGALFAGTTTGIFQYDTTNNTWVASASSPTININQFSVGTSGAFYAATSDGVYQFTTPSGASSPSWVAMNTGLPANTNVTGFSLDSQSNLLASTSTSGIYRYNSTNNTWGIITPSTGLPSNVIMGIASTTDNGKTLIFAFPQNAGVYVSIDDGATWTAFTPAGQNTTQANDIQFFGGSSGGTYYLAMNTGIYTITD